MSKRNNGNTMKIVCMIILLLSCYDSICFGKSWPQVAAVSGNRIFADPATATFQIIIKDIQMKPLYSLSCQSGDMDDYDFNYSGIFHCRLKSLYSHEMISSLLIEDLPQTADWEGRSRFMLNQVVGSCAKTADWGADRTFLLRGMRIVLGIKKVEISGNSAHPTIKSFEFYYDIQPNKDITSPITLKSKVSKPKWFDSDNTCVQEILR